MVADRRTLRQKLAAMATQLEQSPNEAAIAADKLEQRGPEPTLSRETILGAPDMERERRKPIRYRDARGNWVVYDPEDWKVEVPLE